MPERLECEVLRKARHTNTLTITFLPLLTYGLAYNFAVYVVSLLFYEYIGRYFVSEMFIFRLLKLIFTAIFIAQVSHDTRNELVVKS